MSRLSKNILYNLCGQSLLLVLGFIAVKYIFRQLGEDALGIIYFTATVNTILCGVLQKGIYATTVRVVSTHYSENPGYLHKFIQTGSLLAWCVYGLFGFGVYWAAPMLVENWIHLTVLDSRTAIAILRILGIASLIAIPRSFYASLFRGLQRMEFNNAIDVAVSGIQQIGTIFILAAGGNVFHVVYWFAGCYGLGALIYIAVSFRFFPMKSLIPSYSSNVIKQNWRFTSKMASISILAIIHNNAEKLLVSKWLPIGMFGYYGFAYGAVAKAGLITSAISQAAFPSLSKLLKAGSQTALMAQYKKLQDLICFMTVPVFAAIPFASLPLFTFLFDAETAQKLLLPTTFLSVGFYMNGTLSLPYQFSLAAGKPEISVRANIYALFIVLPLTIILIRLWGLTGAGLSWILFNLFSYGYAVPRFCAECMRIPARQWYSHVFKIYILSFSIYGFAWFLLQVTHSDSTVFLALAWIGSSFIFLTGAYFLVSDALRQTFSRHLHDIKANLFFKPIIKAGGRSTKL